MLLLISWLRALCHHLILFSFLRANERTSNATTTYANPTKNGTHFSIHPLLYLFCSYSISLAFSGNNQACMHAP